MSKVMLNENKIRNIIRESIRNVLLERYDERGFNDKSGIHRDTHSAFDPEGYDKDGYDVNGYNKSGWNRKGINMETNDTYDARGYDVNGINKRGRNKDGFDREGFNKNGVNINGETRREAKIYQEALKYFKDKDAYEFFLKKTNSELGSFYNIDDKIDEYLHKSASTICNIPYMPSLEEIVDEEIGCVIDMSTIGSVFNSIREYLDKKYREHEAEYLFKKYCIPLWKTCIKNVDIFSTFNMRSKFINELLKEYINVDENPVYENKWFMMLEDFCNRANLIGNFIEDEYETESRPWYYPDLNDDL